MEAMNAEDPLSLLHPYSPSVIATYRGACDLIATVESIFDQEEQLCSRFLHFCFNAYFAGVRNKIYLGYFKLMHSQRTLSLLIIRAPSSPLANLALQDLERVCRLLKSAAKVQPFCANALVFEDLFY